MPATFDELRAAATRYLAGELAEQWVSLLRPAAGLVHHRSPERRRLRRRPPPVAGRLRLARLGGARPALSHRHGRSGAVVRTVPSGRCPCQVVSAFYWDGARDGGLDIVISEDPESAAGAALLAVPDPAALTGDPVPLPPELTAYPRIWLAARGVWTWPSLDHPAMRSLRDSASDLQWGDIGARYWLAELPPDRSSLGGVRFVWQCH